MKNDKKKYTLKKKPGKSSFVPGLKKEISHFLTSEEAKISPKGVLLGSMSIMGIAFCTDALAGHINQHQNWAPHANIAPHHSVDCGHESQNVHHNAAPHVSVSPHSSAGYPHTNSHANVNEAVTKGTIHNNSADGYGKHTASLGHNNNPNTTTNTGGHYNTVPHFNYGSHSNSAPHLSLGHHVNFAPHYSQAPHYSKHQNGHWNG